MTTILPGPVSCPEVIEADPPHACGFGRSHLRRWNSHEIIKNQKEKIPKVPVAEFSNYIKENASFFFEKKLDSLSEGFFLLL